MADTDGVLWEVYALRYGRSPAYPMTDLVAGTQADQLAAVDWYFWLLRRGRCAVVVDTGVHRKDDGKLCGDIDFDAASARASAITPVPGGVGPMTIAMLMSNTVDACVSRRGLTQG